MPCLLGCLAISFPRVAIILIVIFSDYIGQAYQNWFWPMLGFVFMPLTTLAYAWAFHANGSVTGIYLVVLVVAVLMDLSTAGGSAANREVREVFIPARPAK